MEPQWVQMYVKVRLGGAEVRVAFKNISKGGIL